MFVRIFLDFWILNQGLRFQNIYLIFSQSWNNDSPDDLCLEQTHIYESFKNWLQQGIKK